MKKLFVSFAVVATFGLSSCGNEDAKGEEKKEGETTEKVSQENELDKMCECVTEMLAFGDAMMSEDETEMMEATQKMEVKEKECMELAEKLEEGKSEEELEKMKADFQNNCEALKNI